MTVPEPRLRAWRASLCVLMASLAGILVGLSAITGRFEEVFRQLEMKILPLPTELFLALARLARSVPGILALAAGVIAASLAVWRGKADPHLRKAAVAGILAAGLLPLFFVVAVYLPVLKIQQALR